MSFDPNPLNPNWSDSKVPDETAGGQGMPRQRSFKKWGSFDSSASRQALKENDFAWLENLIQVGDANLQSLNGPSGSLAQTTSGDNVYAAADANIGGIDYIFLFCSNGSGYTFATGSGTLTKFATSGTLSSAGLELAQWQNSRVLLIGPSGYWTYDGTTLTNLVSSFTATGTISNGSGGAGTILNVTGGVTGIISPGQTLSGSGVTSTVIVSYGTGTGGIGTYNVSVSQNVASTAITFTNASVPTAGTDIATYAGRVWACNGRTVTFSAPGSYTDFTTADAGGFFIMSDETLYASIVNMTVANNYLFIVGQSSVDIVSDVRVSGSTTLYTLTNISSNIGATQSDAVIPYLRTLAWLSPRGPYILAGAAPQKLGPNLDGLLPLLTFSTISTATGQLNNQNVLMWGASYNDPLLSGGNRYLLMGFFDGKWFLGSQNSPNQLILIVPAYYQSVPRFYGVDSANNILRLFDNNTSVPSFKLQTALWSEGDPTLDKQVMKFGIEATYPTGNISLTVSSDTERGSTSSTVMNVTLSIWLTAGGLVSTWLTALSAPSTWTAAAYAALYTDATNFGKYYGFTVTGSVPQIAFNGVLSEYLLRARW